VQRLDLVKHQHKPRITRIAQDDQQSGQKTRGTKVIDIS